VIVIGRKKDDEKEVRSGFYSGLITDQELRTIEGAKKSKKDSLMKEKVGIKDSLRPWYEVVDNIFEGYVEDIDGAEVKVPGLKDLVEENDVMELIVKLGRIRIKHFYIGTERFDKEMHELGWQGERSEYWRTDIVPGLDLNRQLFILTGKYEYLKESQKYEYGRLDIVVSEKKIIEIFSDDIGKLEKLVKKALFDYKLKSVGGE
jgi:hypothetical protein